MRQPPPNLRAVPLHGGLPPSRRQRTDYLGRGYVPTELDLDGCATHGRSVAVPLFAAGDNPGQGFLYACAGLLSLVPCPNPPSGWCEDNQPAQEAREGPAPLCEPHGYADAQQERTEAPEGPPGRPPTKYHRRRNDFPGGGPPHSI